jgi:hypothetical protein
MIERDFNTMNREVCDLSVLCTSRMEKPVINKETTWSFAVRNSYFRMFKFCDLDSLCQEICRVGDIKALRKVCKFSNLQEMFHTCCIHNHPDLIEFLLANGFKPENSALSMVIPNYRLTELLLKHGADPNTGVRRACAKFSLEILELLMKYGANPNSDRPLELVGRGDDVCGNKSEECRKIITILLENGAEITDTIFSKACKVDSNLDIIKLFLAKNPGLNIQAGLEIAKHHRCKNITGFLSGTQQSSNCTIS